MALIIVLRSKYSATTDTHWLIWNASCSDISLPHHACQLVACWALQMKNYRFPWGSASGLEWAFSERSWTHPLSLIEGSRMCRKILKSKLLTIKIDGIKPLYLRNWLENLFYFLSNIPVRRLTLKTIEKFNLF